MKLDKKDLILLDYLIHNPNFKRLELMSELKLSRKSLNSRIKKLENIVIGPMYLFDFSPLGFTSVRVECLIRGDDKKIEKILEEIKNNFPIWWYSKVFSGEFNILLDTYSFHYKDIEELIKYIEEIAEKEGLELIKSLERNFSSLIVKGINLTQKFKGIYYKLFNKELTKFVNKKEIEFLYFLSKERSINIISKLIKKDFKTLKKMFNDLKKRKIISGIISYPITKEINMEFYRLSIIPRTRKSKKLNELISYLINLDNIQDIDVFEEGIIEIEYITENVGKMKETINKIFEKFDFIDSIIIRPTPEYSYVNFFPEPMYYKIKEIIENFGL